MGDRLKSCGDRLKMLKLPCERGEPVSRLLALGVADVAGGASSAAASVLWGPFCTRMLIADYHGSVECCFFQVKFACLMSSLAGTVCADFRALALPSVVKRNKQSFLFFLKHFGVYRAALLIIPDLHSRIDAS